MDVTINGTKYVPEHSPDVKAGRSMRGLRGLNGFSLTAAATAIGCSKSHLSAIENGTSEPGLSLTVRMSTAYGVTLDDVAGAMKLTMQPNT